MIRISRNETGKAKIHLGLNLVKNVKDNKNCFFKYINNKMKTKDNVDPLLNGGESLVAEDTEKARLLNTTFALVFTKTSPLTQKTRVKKSWKEEFPLVREDWVREYLDKFDIFKSMYPDRIHQSVLIELVDTMTS